MSLIDDPAELAAHYGLPWPADACQCCGGRIIDGRCLGADRCHRGRCAGLTAEEQPRMTTTDPTGGLQIVSRGGD
jgi:hypothetical protein